MRPLRPSIFGGQLDAEFLDLAVQRARMHIQGLGRGHTVAAASSDDLRDVHGLEIPYRRICWAFGSFGGTAITR